jgi:hypothetical protein
MATQDLMARNLAEKSFILVAGADEISHIRKREA